MPGTEEEIRKKAHAIWEKEGRPEGQHERHWDEAVKELKKTVKATRGKKANGEADTAEKKAVAKKASAADKSKTAKSATAKASTGAVEPAVKGKKAASPKTPATSRKQKVTTE